jgi:hypothetical protein
MTLSGYLVTLVAAVFAQFAVRGFMDGAGSSFVAFCVYGFVFSAIVALKSRPAPLTEKLASVPPDNKGGGQ